MMDSIYPALTLMKDLLVYTRNEGCDKTLGDKTAHLHSWVWGFAASFVLIKYEKCILFLFWQAIRRWMQRKPREATKKHLAEMLHEMDRDDLATQLK